VAFDWIYSGLKNLAEGRREGYGMLLIDPEKKTFEEKKREST